MTDEYKREAEQQSFKEGFEAVMKPVVDWLNLKPDNARTARFTFCYSRVETDVELSQGVGSYNVDSTTIKSH